MKELEPGHVYWLDILDGEAGQAPCILSFVKRVGEHYPGNKTPARPGPTSQEVLRALIARTEYVDGQIEHEENSKAIGSLREALYSFELRAAMERDEQRRFVRHVEDWEGEIEDMPTCRTCGHIACGRH